MDGDGRGVIDTNKGSSEETFELSVRPSCFADFVGQEKAKANLSIMVQASKMRDEACDHILFAAGFLGQFPRLLAIKILVGGIGQRHYLAHRLGIFALLIVCVTIYKVIELWKER